MSLEASITDLVNESRSLVNTFKGKKVEIDAAAQAAVASASNLFKTIWLNELNGDDANTGLSREDALKTLGKAIEMCSTNVTLTIMCVGDVTMTREYYYCPPRSYIKLVSAEPKTDGSQYTLKVSLAQSADGWVVSSFATSEAEINVAIYKFKIDLPANPSALPIMRDFLVYTWNDGVINRRVNLSNCNIIAAGRVGNILRERRIGTTELYLSSCTYVTSDMAGRWIKGVAAGTNPNTFVDVFTNLNTL